MAVGRQQTDISKDGTVKFLFELEDRNRIETVLMFHDYGCSVCVSSQAGCNMGCAFCASGLMKKARDLTAQEMLEQVAAAARFLEEAEPHPKISHIVVMGTGEPFDNYDEVIRFCDLISDEKKLKTHEPEGLLMPIAPRHITVSTCGIIPKIEAFAATLKRYNLAVSLHAPDDAIRDRLMPVNKVYPIRDLVKAAADYCEKTGRRVTFEYILLDGINDSPECAAKLAALLQEASEKASQYFYINLIPYNNVSEFGFKGTDKTKALDFYDILMKSGIKATLRKERGSDIAAACGQLRLGL